MNLREQVPLAPLTTLGVGGAARYFVEAESEADVREALQFTKERDLPLFILGGGSNLVVADAGFAGLVLKVCLRGISRTTQGSDFTFRVAAGEDWDRFVAQAVEDNCAGVECLSGIPGLVGATPVQNVGAYGQDVAETIREVVALDRQTMELRAFCNSDCGFGYRSKHLQHKRPRPFHYSAGFVQPCGKAEVPLFATQICRSILVRRIRNLRCNKCAMRCARFAAAKRCYWFLATKTRAAPDRSSRIPWWRKVNSRN